ncbi:hypothetical protein MMPV_002789 [Pyropia vietnamensis]
MHPGGFDDDDDDGDDDRIILSRAEIEGAQRSLEDYRSGVRWSVPEWDTVNPLDGSVIPTYTPGRSWASLTARKRGGRGAGGGRRKDRSEGKYAAMGRVDDPLFNTQALAQAMAKEGGRKRKDDKSGKSGESLTAAAMWASMLPRADAAAGGRRGGRAAAGGGGSRPPLAPSRTLLKTLVSRSVASYDTCAVLISIGMVFVDGVVETDPWRKVAPDAQMVIRGQRLRAVVSSVDRGAPPSSQSSGDPLAEDPPVLPPRVRRDLGGEGDGHPRWKGDKGGGLPKKYTSQVDGGFYAARRRAAK